MTFKIKSVPNKEVIIPFINEEAFQYLKAIPEDKVKEEAKIAARVGNFVKLKALLQETGVPHHLAEMDFEEFDKSDDDFRQWVIDKKVIMPFTREYQPMSGKLMWKARVQHPECIVDFYAEKLSDLFIKQMFFQHRNQLLANFQAEVVFIDRWLVVNSYETFEAMQEALKTFQEAVEKKAEQFIKQEENEAENAFESV